MVNSKTTATVYIPTDTSSDKEIVLHNFAAESFHTKKELPRDRITPALLTTTPVIVQASLNLNSCKPLVI